MKSKLIERISRLDPDLASILFKDIIVAVENRLKVLEKEQKNRRYKHVEN